MIPSLITGAGPGEIFELRTAGNSVTDHREDAPSSEAATIEYAVSVLGVSEVIVCGHSYCGAVGARVRGEDLSAAPSVRAWLDQQIADDLYRFHDGDPSVAAAVQCHVKVQLERLRSHPSVRRRLDEGSLAVHGWFYEIDTGLVMVHDPDLGAFLPA